MDKEICELTTSEMAEKMFQDVYALLPDSTTWIPDFMAVKLTQDIVVAVITNTMDFQIWNEKKFFYWQEVINKVKQIKG